MTRAHGPEAEIIAEPAGGRPRDSKEARVAAALRTVWEQSRVDMFLGVDIVQRAASAAFTGAFGDHRRAAEREAHKLAGSLGTFGVPEGSRLAREIELLLQADVRPTFRDASRLTELVAALRLELERHDSGPDPAPGAEARGPLLLIIDGDPHGIEKLRHEASARGIRIASTRLPSARALIRSDRPDAVLLHLGAGVETVTGMALLQELGQGHAIPALVMAPSDSFEDRVKIARLGGRGFLHTSMPPGVVLETIAQVLDAHRTVKGKVLAVDDDPMVLGVLRALLTPGGIELDTLEDPLRFWDVLHDTTPDLVILDVDMPDVSGMELCRIVRNDPRWHQLPVLFLTARSDTATVEAIFQAGADDFVAKPVVGPELMTRITNRLERTRLSKSLAETDPLTGVANRRKSAQVLSQYLLLAQRHALPLSIALIDLDHFKAVNDRHGHAAGDAVLRRLGQVLNLSCREEDVVARWGGEEFVIGMYGMSRDTAVRRLNELLETFGAVEFPVPDDEGFRVSFSAGVAVYPGDGTDIQALYRSADRALYRAKAHGRARVVAARAK